MGRDLENFKVYLLLGFLSNSFQIWHKFSWVQGLPTNEEIFLDLGQRSRSWGHVIFLYLMAVSKNFASLPPCCQYLLPGLWRSFSGQRSKFRGQGRAVIAYLHAPSLSCLRSGQFVSTRNLDGMFTKFSRQSSSGLYWPTKSFKWHISYQQTFNIGAYAKFTWQWIAVQIKIRVLP